MMEMGGVDALLAADVLLAEVVAALQLLLLLPPLPNKKNRLLVLRRHLLGLWIALVPQMILIGMALMGHQSTR
jgi:hypothetical protein